MICKSIIFISITKIYLYIVDEIKSIYIAWVKLKQYCCKVIIANMNLKIIYLDKALFLYLLAPYKICLNY
jgi:hypothetical protein